jgi:hypothetical protein
VTESNGLGEAAISFPQEQIEMKHLFLLGALLNDDCGFPRHWQ